MITKDDDPVEQILVCDTHDMLLFFTNRGRVLSVKSYELRADTSRNTRGVPVVNVIPLTEGEKVHAIVGVDSLQHDDLFLLMGTRRGLVKRVALSEISSIRRSGLIIMNMKSDDELVSARLVKEEDEIIMVSRQGMSIRFPVSEIKARRRVAGGVKGMVLRARDRIVSMDAVAPEGKLLVISRRGFGKLTDLKRYRPQGRGGLGLKTFNITKKTGPVAAADVIDDSTEVYVVSEQAQVLRTSLSEIRSTGRATQGVTIFKPAAGDSVAAIACVGELKVPADVEAGPSPPTNGRGNGRVPPNKHA